MKSDLKRGHVLIEAVEPTVDGGRYPAKTIAGDRLEVSADIIRDGPSMIMAVVRYRGPGARRWSETRMSQGENDRFMGSFRPHDIGAYEFAIEAWTDRFGTWRRDLLKRAEAGQDLDVELQIGATMVEAVLPSLNKSESKVLTRVLEAFRSNPPEAVEGAEGLDPRTAPLMDELVVELMNSHADRTGSTTSDVYPLTVDRERALFGAWYEFFPRSTGTQKKHGTFKTAEKGLPRIADMGFDVVYLPPIHPIGMTHRKGTNNTLEAGPKDVGSPWAIGGPAGGHDALHPDLGTIQDFEGFVAAAEGLGLEVALDFAIQCSPDHPWVTEHPEWFNHLPDGTIRYAENPPKKYQDIYPINFDTTDAEGLWTALRQVLEHWISHGVKIFRVDNPHTKAFPFWEWVIRELKKEHPELIFLAEAFTRPKVMKALAKLGFTQSYTYFTWRNSKPELIEYMDELTRTDMSKYFRPNFFANTPDILHEFLQVGGPPAFRIRFVLASMLSPTYGIYSGFELFENTPVKQGSEEYLHSEKYELKPRDFSAEGSLVPYITQINDIRRKHPALTRLANLEWHDVDKDNLLAFSKSSPDGDVVLTVVNLNPFNWEEGTIHFDRTALGVGAEGPFEVHDLIGGETWTWDGDSAYVRLEPKSPAHIFEVRG